MIYKDHWQKIYRKIESSPSKKKEKQMASISRAHFSNIVQREQESRATMVDAFRDTVTSDFRAKGVHATAIIMSEKAATVFKGFAKIFAHIDSPIAGLMEEVLGCAGISPNIFTAAQLLFQSDSIGLDPHEKLGVTLWQYKLVEKIHDLMDELQQLERSATYSHKLDRKKEIEQELQERIQSLKW